MAILHVGAFYALQSGLAKSVVDAVTGPLETRLIEEMVTEADEPPPPPPELDAPPPEFIPMPDIAIDAPAPQQTISNVTAVKKPPPPPPPPKVVPPRTNPRRPITQPEYPTMSRRLGEEGEVVLLLTVDESGRITEASVEESSGFERLDEAAVREALRRWRLIPGTVNGQPSTMQHRIRVTFQIED
ncbi:MAG: energy transducer TonB [Rhodospirillaceae bacterium]